jgi:hypothetical protein
MRAKTFSSTAQASRTGRRLSGGSSSASGAMGGISNAGGVGSSGGFGLSGMAETITRVKAHEKETEQKAKFATTCAKYFS